MAAGHKLDQVHSKHTVCVYNYWQTPVDLWVELCLTLFERLLWISA